MLMELHSKDKANLCDLLAGEVRNPQQKAITDNKREFDIKKEELRKKYPEGSYVAIYRGIPIIVGDDPGEVADEFYNRYGKQAVYVGKLSDNLDVIEMSSPVIDSD